MDLLLDGNTLQVSDGEVDSDEEPEVLEPTDVRVQSYVFSFGKYKNFQLSTVLSQKKGRNYLRYLLTWPQLFEDLRGLIKYALKRVKSPLVKTKKVYTQKLKKPTLKRSHKKKRKKVSETTEQPTYSHDDDADDTNGDWAQNIFP